MTVSVRMLEPLDVDAVAEFFSAIAADEATVTFFHPHDFDRETAERICNREGIELDEYFGAFADGAMQAYGMLRGWDEGYETPSFGVCVHPLHRGEGLGSLILDYAITEATRRGAKRMMLKVFGDNAVARSLYESRGFVFEAYDAEQLVGFKTLA